MSGFPDHFSSVADGYHCFRPDYPETLFDYLARLAPSPDSVWDCATGNGQAANALASRFRRVVATDASADQIAKARPSPNIDYRVATAEASGLPPTSVDLVTVAQALHWLDLSRFYAEVGRVLRPGGLLAVWSYNLLNVDRDVDVIIDKLYQQILGPFWPLERQKVETGYRDLPFPFRELTPPPFVMGAEWRLPQLMGYLRTWSAVARYRDQLASDPLEQIVPELTEAWGDRDRTRPVRWPLTVRVGAS